MQQRQKEIEEMAKLPKEELIRRLMQWKPGQPWPSGVPKPPVGWKPGDPLAFLAEAPKLTSDTTVAEKQPSNVAAEEKKQEKQQQQQQQQQLSLDFGDDDADDEEDFDDDAFDFDVVSASDGDDESD